ncbi:MAG: type II toxin-antitoxin system VapC family toxin [Mesorhizobium sp.]|nr:type II toxin-antitoxin system VapC family toxin [Mesorhizobium sp.]
MFVDTSAIVSIVVDEEDAGEFAACLARTSDRTIGAVTQVEAAISVGRYHGGDYSFGASQVADFVERAGIKVLDVPADLIDEVLKAYQRYGKGTGHRARLNFGDCFSYAFAKRLKAPLLFKGEDFSKTDIEAAL